MSEPRLKAYDRTGRVRAEAIVDPETYVWACRYRWYMCGAGYFQRDQRIDGKRRRFLLHREILGLEHGDPLRGDHINRNPLDNRRANLRVATQSQNAQNCNDKGGSSRFRGVSRKGSKWRAYGNLDNRFHHLGYFEDEEDAAAVAAAFRESQMSHASASPVKGDDTRERTAPRAHYPHRRYSLNALYAYCRKHGYRDEERALSRYRHRKAREAKAVA